MRIFRFLSALAALAALTLPAAAQNRDDAYTVTGIHVDVTAKSSTEAFTTAIANGRPQAFQILFRRLTQQKDWSHQPNLDQVALVRLSRGYNVANERRSTTRYVADVTYLFNPAAVDRLLRGAGIAFTVAAPTIHVLLIPMSPNVSGGAWEQTLANPAAQEGRVVPVSLPSADDLRALSKLTLDASWNDVAATADKAHAGAAALMQAVYAGGKVTVNLRLLGPNQAPARASVDVPMTGTVSTAYLSAAQAALVALDDLWKARVTVDPNQRGRITAEMRIASLQQWGDTQAALAGIPTVTAVTVVAMDTGFARLTIAYTGSGDQLRDALSAAHVSLTNSGGRWTLAPGG